MLLTNNYYRITNKVYKFIFEGTVSSKDGIRRRFDDRRRKRYGISGIRIQPVRTLAARARVPREAHSMKFILFIWK